MKPDKSCFEFIESKEGLSLNAYLDSAGIPTIGYGIIEYEDGSKVKLGDKITKERANELMEWQIGLKAEKVSEYTIGLNLTQNQYNALVSLTYNIGVSAFKKSTVLKKVIAGEDVKASFLMWNKVRVDGKLIESHGLTNRRLHEIKLYYS